MYSSEQGVFDLKALTWGGLASASMANQEVPPPGPGLIHLNRPVVFPEKKANLDGEGRTMSGRTISGRTTSGDSVGFR